MTQNFKNFLWGLAAFVSLIIGLIGLFYLFKSQSSEPKPYEPDNSFEEFIKEQREEYKKNPPSPESKKVYKFSYWLNINTNTRHNSRCKYYGNTTNGRSCSSSEGRACQKCGG